MLETHLIATEPFPHAYADSPDSVQSALVREYKYNYST